jgi:hypothetical protein
MKDLVSKMMPHAPAGGRGAERTRRRCAMIRPGRIVSATGLLDVCAICDKRSQQLARPWYGQAFKGDRSMTSGQRGGEWH